MRKAFRKYFTIVLKLLMMSLNKVFLHKGQLRFMDRSIILQVENVTRQFSSTAAPAVNQISLQLHQGDLLALLGPSGCGKTTLLRLIAGFERPQQGKIVLAGRSVSGAGAWVPPERRDVGMVFQDYALFPHLTVAKNVAFGLKNWRHRPAATQIRALTQQAIALVGLSGLENRYPHQLSGGQQQRVALARALAPRPSLILLDEPLSNLDMQVRLKLRQEIRDILKSTQTSGVFVTHDQEEALSIADQVAVMRQGNLEQVGTPEAIYQHPSTRFVAEFVAQANFLPAQLRGDRWETEVGSFAAIDDQDSSINGKKAMGQPLSPSLTPPPSLESRQALPATADLMIRQEDLRFEPNPTGSVTIRDRQFLGREHRYCLLSASGQTLYARTPVKTSLPIGTRVSLTVVHSSLQVFPDRNAKSSDRI